MYVIDIVLLLPAVLVRYVLQLSPIIFEWLMGEKYVMPPIKVFYLCIDVQLLLLLLINK